MRADSGPTVRVALLGELGAGNIGNEASLAAALAMLRRLGPVDPLVLASVPGLVTAEHGVAAAPLVDEGARRGGLRGVLGKLRDARYAWRATGRVDAVVVPGTGVLEGLGVHPGAMPLTLLWFAVAARLRRRPFLLLSVGVDGSGGRLVRSCFRWVLRLSTYVSVRDAGSARCAVGLGLRVPPVVVPDLVLGLPVLDDVGPAPTGVRRPLVAVGVVNYVWYAGSRTAEARQDYLDRTVELVRRLVADGMDVRVLGGDAADAATAREVVDGVARPQHVTTVRVDDLVGVEDALSGCAALAAVRYHNLVAAVRLGLPVVSLGYGPKQRWLLERFGAADRVHTMEDFDPVEVAGQLGEIVRGPGSEAAVAVAELGRAQRELDEQEHRVGALLRLHQQSGAITAAGPPEGSTGAETGAETGSETDRSVA